MLKALSVKEGGESRPSLAPVSAQEPSPRNLPRGKRKTESTPRVGSGEHTLGAQITGDRVSICANHPGESRIKNSHRK